MTAQERQDVINQLWTFNSINIDYLNKMSDEDLKRLYKDKFR